MLVLLRVMKWPYTLVIVAILRVCSLSVWVEALTLTLFEDRHPTLNTD